MEIILETHLSFNGGKSEIAWNPHLFFYGYSDFLIIIYDIH